MRVISEFKGPHRWLSNFAPSPVRLDGLTYPTVEHAFQAAKTMDPDEREAIRMKRSPGEAKRAGRKVTLRPDWERVKTDVMRGLLEQKFACPHLRRLLMTTSDARIVEGNDWGDTFWGVYRGVGENHLGRIIMAIRDTVLREGRT